MKSVSRVLVNGFAGIMQGVKRLGVYAVASGLILAVYAPVSARAEAMTQIECLQWLVQVTGEAAQFTASSTSADLVQWARVKGMNPTGGWQPNAVLSRETLAQILVQLLGINPNKRGGDYIRVLEREGIVIPASGDISREDIVNLLGDIGEPRIGNRNGPPFTPPGPPPNVPPVSPHKKGNNGRGNGEDPPPPGWLKKPKHPHYNEDVPGR